MNFDQGPAWAHNWCYYFLGIGVLSAALGLFAMFEKRASAALIFAILLSAGMQFATAMTLFWMCRRSLA